MINRLSNPINRNRSAAKISKVMSSNGHALSRQAEPPFVEQEAHPTAHSLTQSAGGWNAEVFHRQPPKSWK